MATRKARSPRRSRRQSGGESWSDAAVGLGSFGLALSVLKNIDQASEREELQQQRKRLLEFLRQWQESHQRLEARYFDLLRASETLRGQVDQLEARNQQLQSETQRLNQQLANLNRPSEGGGQENNP